jgi:hypothetical protein
MANRAIKISILKTGQIVCKPDPAHVKHNDNIKWSCTPPADFTVHFGMITPIGRAAIKGSKGISADYDVLANATPVGYRLKFKYTVAVKTKEEILVADPTIIIDP